MAQSHGDLYLDLGQIVAPKEHNLQYLTNLINKIAVGTTPYVPVGEEIIAAPYGLHSLAALLHAPKANVGSLAAIRLPLLSRVEPGHSSTAFSNASGWGSFVVEKSVLPQKCGSTLFAPDNGIKLREKHLEQLTVLENLMGLYTEFAEKRGGHYDSGLSAKLIRKKGQLLQT
jgi:hypothetical protein